MSNSVHYFLKIKPYTEISSLSEFNTVIKTNSRVVVDFYASWCGPCKMISPVFIELAQDYPLIKCIKVNVDTSPEIARECGIRSMPTFRFYRQGGLVKEFTGANPSHLKYEFSHL
ncbi:thioredoxin-3, mitochondrial precursor, putative [Entamoeba dispar SAW760]|uniref:Thioredoxin-3, mitochondrial, putative n=1 Tax=Entamoeba dispar (strain ATCC PRA-260 / SAW760) TaxID=370354 RepID=B0ED12_ENTDS|nr:thioredoxin-3, mitochondrial precursor, putative [Entamoeba dispar SAW760]EDR27429.1 thioredoxin-3, mitochondrial precursor, putative [Entamoeba dispar SAW760]|eukprot:EDR27429.1 thioredoxin-3, mitochondrial precursor, putative [Entamoeba dispar SAW760]